MLSVMTLLDELRAIPLRFWALALGWVVVLAFWGQATRWVPWSASNTVLADGWGDGVHSLSVVVWALAPVLALRWPLPTGVVVCLPLLATLTEERSTLPFTLGLSLLACAMTATWSRPRTGVLLASAAVLVLATWAAGWTIVLMPYGAQLQESANLSGLLVTGLLYAVPAAASLGFANWMRLSALGAQRESAVLGRERAAAEQAAVVSERARLARDLHDVVAHHVSLIAVRAETAPYTVPDLQPEARAVLAEVAADARLALDELRGVLGILGRAEADLELAPQPSLADVAGLVERAGSAGQQVELQLDRTRDEGPVPPATGYAAYRVVQEALTNARKHAPGSPVRVAVRRDGAVLRVTVTNPVPAGERPGAAGGHGLVGMRERVVALGGELTAGPATASGDADYVVTATFPLELEAVR
jgi:signal transduction histidine kinase